MTYAKAHYIRAAVWHMKRALSPQRFYLIKHSRSWWLFDRQADEPSRHDTWAQAYDTALETLATDRGDCS